MKKKEKYVGIGDYPNFCNLSISIAPKQLWEEESRKKKKGGGYFFIKK
jgi:hypothetical protein